MSRRNDTASADRPLRVVQVGPRRASADSRGGIATVMSLVLARPGDDVRLEHVVTYDDGGGRAHKAKVALTGMARLARRVAARDVDVVHAHMSFKGSVLRKGLALRIARAAGVPTVLHAHSHGFTLWFTGLPRYQQVAVRTLLRADRWIVLGNRWAQEYVEELRLDPRRVAVVHNPTVAPSPSPDVRWQWPADTGSGERQVRMVFLGRIGERKGSFDLVRALARLDPAMRTRLHLVMAGDGDVSGVEAAAEAAGVRDSIEFPGWVGEATRAALLDTADVLLLPSHEEGLPMAVLEGMAAGLAVLTTPVGGIPEVITHGDDGLLVTPGADEEIAAALTHLVVDAPSRAQLGARARQRSAAYDIEHWYTALDRIWHDVAAGRLEPAGPSPAAPRPRPTHDGAADPGDRSASSDGADRQGAERPSAV